MTLSPILHIDAVAIDFLMCSSLLCFTCHKSLSFISFSFLVHVLLYCVFEWLLHLAFYTGLSRAVEINAQSQFIDYKYVFFENNHSLVLVRIIDFNC